MATESVNSGAKLYLHAKDRIPGGTQLLSKRPEMFLPDQWPAYYSRCKGCEVWDLDGRRLTDMSTMGIGSCILGYADDDVNLAVREAVDRGSMCTLNSPAEVALADLLCELHPWAQKVRFARCGGEAMAVATRIARAWSGRDKVAFCGYHGWHDWYLAANLADDSNLDGHLLAGLEPRLGSRAVTLGSDARARVSLVSGPPLEIAIRRKTCAVTADGLEISMEESCSVSP